MPLRYQQIAALERERRDYLNSLNAPAYAVNASSATTQNGGKRDAVTVTGSSVATLGGGDISDAA